MEDAYPLAALQAGMIFHSVSEPDAATYHDLTTLTLRARFEREALETALAQVSARHPVLRTAIDLTSFSEALQFVYNAVTLPLEVTDLRTSGDPQADIAAWSEREKRHPFDWASPPLARCHVHLLPGDDSFAFSFSFHHAILDGWSVAALMTEILGRYEALLDGRSLPAPPPAAAFRDLVAAERAAVASPHSRSFWQQRVADLPQTRVPQLPGPFAAEQGVSVLRRPVPAALLDRLEATARELRVPLRTVLLAAHLRVLALVSGQDEVVTGLVTHNRPENEGGEEVLGLFLNTVPVRLDVTAPTWGELVKRVFDEEVALLPHRQYPLFEIQRLSGRTPMLEVLFDFRDFHVYRGLPGIRIEGQEFFEETDLAFAAGFTRSREHGGFDLTLTYDRQKYGSAQMEAVAGCYLTALEQAADPGADPRPASPYLGADAAAVEAWNDTARPYRTGLLHELIAERAAEQPGAPAVCFAGRWITYGELAERARELAGRLRAAGAGPDHVVGVRLERGPDLLPALLGVLMAGAAYLPLESSVPDERQADMIAQAGARIVIGDGLTLDVLDGPAPETAAGQEDSLAYVIFTSGSTGRPKGVGVSHRAIVNRLEWMQETFRLTPDDRVLHKTPLSFDVSVWELFWPLLAGAGLVVAEPGAHQDGARLAELITAHDVGIVHFVPSMLQLFLDEPELPGGLRRVVCSGEALGPELAARFHERLPGAELHNLYGPTEAAVDVTWHACVPGERIVPIGGPVANTRLEVLDASGRRVPVGTPGELHLGGVQLARGYVGRPGLTAERFVPDPYGPPGARLYRTGDVARWLPGGEIEYLGRTDFQVKIRGQRVELGEIETRLAERPDLRAAVVTLRGERLVGYLVPASGEQPPPAFAVIGADLRRHLPDHMVPSAWVWLEELPVTANGKLDRAALPEPDAPERAPYVPPRDPFEARLATLFEETLGVQAIGVHDDFFALGGHSLLALRLTMLLRKELDRTVPLPTVLTAPTVASLATELRRPADNDAAADRIVPLRTAGPRTPIFLFHALGGQVFRYLPLSRRLGADQPVYTVQAAGLAPGESPHTTLDEMVDDYTAHIRKVRPHGPYILGGYCIGGNIALETARRLRALGEQVPLVVLFYSDADEPVIRASLEDDSVLLMHALAGGNVRMDLDELHRMRPDERLLAVIDAAARSDTLQPDAADLNQARRFLSVFRANAHAVGHYRHEPYDGDVLLFSPTSQDVPPDDMGWRKVITGSLRISPIHGERFTVMYEPRVALAADELRSTIDHGVTPH
ncbi:amino acid adenylation domain-containing protein [Nonomuraea sp. NPDC050663]|uniref:amino acid adenylation domain-containing protein n=1 Tax=Nonomuraea sp. NPDC050663 TaxID=3364370 RepID=UPI00378CAAC6